MKVVLDKDEAEALLGELIASKFIPGMQMKATEITWSRYETEVTITLEPAPKPDEGGPL